MGTIRNIFRRASARETMEHPLVREMQGLTLPGLSADEACCSTVLVDESEWYVYMSPNQIWVSTDVRRAIGTGAITMVQAVAISEDPDHRLFTQIGFRHGGAILSHPETGAELVQKVGETFMIDAIAAVRKTIDLATPWVVAELDDQQIVKTAS